MFALEDNEVHCGFDGVVDDVICVCESDGGKLKNNFSMFFEGPIQHFY